MAQPSDFTPRSYFTERDLQLALPSDIMDQARRAVARRLVDEAKIRRRRFSSQILRFARFGG